MPNLSRFLALCLLAFATISQVRAESAATNLPAVILDEVKAADRERLAAMANGDAGRLGAIFSDELRYAHSTGKVDTKASFVQRLASRQSVYEKIDYVEQTFAPASPDVVLMSGRALLRVRNGAQPVDLDLAFLAVWRREAGHWRFLAWQSCPMPKTP